MDNRFIIVTTVYNNEECIKKCIESVLCQDYNNYEMIIVDDCSTDNTLDNIMKYNVNAVRNKERIGSSIANIIKGIRLMSPDDDDIILSLDGDDYLAGNFVFSYLNSIYNPDIWLTYGQSVTLSGEGDCLCQDLSHIEIISDDGIKTINIKPNEYRKSNVWCTSHPKTFRYWLWEKINDDDLRDDDGGYFKSACDMAMMIPMIEMADAHSRFIDKILYIYNDMTSHYGKNLEITAKNAECIKNKTPYDYCTYSNSARKGRLA